MTRHADIDEVFMLCSRPKGKGGARRSVHHQECSRIPKSQDWFVSGPWGHARVRGWIAASSVKLSVKCPACGGFPQSEEQ